MKEFLVRFRIRNIPILLFTILSLFFIFSMPENVKAVSATDSCSSHVIGYNSCSTCSGSGKTTSNCSNCGGDGKITSYEKNSVGNYKIACSECLRTWYATPSTASDSMYCSACDKNTGKRVKTTSNCSVCGATGKVTVNCGSCSGTGINYSSPIYGTHESAGNATCTANATCSHCGASIDGTALGHNWGGSYTKYPGYYVEICSRCSAEQNKKANTYYVKYNANGGSGTAPTNLQLTYDATSNLCDYTPFYKTGYSLTGWKIGSTSYSLGASVKNLTTTNGEVLTAYAIWTPNEYTVTFNCNATTKSGTVMGTYVTNIGEPSFSTKTKTVIYDSAYGTLPTITRRGYTFDGWYTSASGGTKVEASTIYQVAGNQNLYAHWTINQYTVTYNVNGGSSVSTASKTVTYNSKIDLTVTATKDNYEFVGWGLTKSATKGCESLVIDNKNVTLYAIYSIPVSDVATVQATPFKLNSSGQISNYYTSSKTNLSLSERTSGTGTAAYLLGYKAKLAYKNMLSGLSVSLKYFGVHVSATDYAGNTGTIKIYTQGDSPDPPEPVYYTQTVVHLIYDENSSGTTEGYDVSYDASNPSNSKWIPFETTTENIYAGDIVNGTFVSNNVTYTPSYVTAPDGYQSYKIDGSYVVTEAKTSYAYYTPITYTLYFDANGGSVDITSKSIIYGSTYGSMPTPEWEGHTFLGWYTNKDSGTIVKESDIYLIKGDSTVYAHWSTDENLVIYDYSTNGGTNLIGNDVSADKNYKYCAYGNNIDLTVTGIKAGWEFIGWNTDANATEGLSSIKMGTETVYLYAIYRKTLTATFIDCKYDGTQQTRETAVNIYNNESSYVIDVLDQTEYKDWICKGWTLNDTSASADIETIGGNTYTLTKDVTFYGVYQKDITVSYDANGGPDTPASSTKTRLYNASGNNQNPTFTIADKLTRENYSFVIWIADDTNNTEYTPQTSHEFDRDTVLTAKWDKYPEIEAYDRYFTLEEAQNGDITASELLSSATGTDLEDGVLEKGTALTMKDFVPDDFTMLTSSADISITYRAEDSFGNVTEKMKVVHVVDTSIQNLKFDSYLRFIDDEFYKDGDNYIPSENGGLEDTSIWITDESYATELSSALYNEKTNQETTDVTIGTLSEEIIVAGSGEYEHNYQKWSFSSEDIKDVKNYVNENGWAKYKNSDALANFIETFKDCLQ